MDIVAALATQLKLEPDAAGGLAGGLLSLVEDIVREKHSFAAAAVIPEKIPEMRGWRMSAPTLAPGALSLKDLAQAKPLAGAEAEFVGVLTRFGLDASAMGLAASVLHQFLATRLDAAALARVTEAMPLLVTKP